MPNRIPPFLFRSVRGRLVLLVAALVLPVIALACAMVVQAYRNERSAVATTMLGTARAVSGEADEAVQESALLLDALSTSGDLARDNFAALDATARRALRGDARWFVVLTPVGQQLVNTRFSPGTPLPKVALSPELLTAARAGHLYVSDHETSPAVSGLVLHVSRPYERDGHLKYILTMTIPPAALAQALDVERYAPGKIVAMLDRHGIIIARSHNPGQFLGRRATPEIVRAITTQQEGIVDTTSMEHTAVLTAFSRAKCGWTTVIAVSKSQLYAGSRRVLAWGGIGSVVLILIAITMAVWIGRALVRSTDLLLAEAAALARGQMPANVSTGLDESDFVSRAMRRTAGTLLRRTHTLEVLTRTNARLVAERDLQRILQQVTDAGRELSRADFGAFFYEVADDGRPPQLLHTVSGTVQAGFAAPKAAGGRDALEPLFAGAAVVRAADITAEPETARRLERLGFATDRLRVRSLLALPVTDGNSAIIGAALFGHREPGVFTRETEDVLGGLISEATLAIDNAKLYHALALELDAKSRAEAELRGAQQRLSEHAQELERRVAERTASLREAVSQMEEFSYTVSHDLRGPLRAMHAFADALVEDYAPKLDATARDYIGRIQRASRRMEQLTTDLLSYSRIARAEVRLEPVDLDRLVRSTVEHYGELHAEAANVRIDSPLLPVRAHPPSLTQCVANLLTNAAKFVKPGEKPDITVRTEQRDGHVRLWVEDKGIGINPAYQKQLFRIFERLPNPHAYEGTGVGLAIVRRAAEKMGGTCGVESDGLSGSRFWVELTAA